MLAQDPKTKTISDTQQAQTIVKHLLEFSDYCSCGHLESQHADWTGPCRCQSCKCAQYRYRAR